MIRVFINAVWDRWANWHPFLRFLILVALGALLALVTVKPGYRLFKTWRVGKNLADAKVAVEAVRMDEARDLSLSVLRSGDPSIEAFRILEKSTASLRDPRHGDIARALMSHPGGSDADRLSGFRGMVPEAPLGLLGQAWASLPVSVRQQPEFAVAFADRLIGAGRLGEAASVLLAVPENSRNPAVGQRLVRLLIKSGKRDGFDEAQRRIVAEWPADATGVAGWLDVLEEIPVLGLRPDLLGRVREGLSRPDAEDPARNALMVGRIDYMANFPARAALLERVVSRWRDEAPVKLAKFLEDLGLNQMLLETFPPETLAVHPDLFPHLLAAMELAGQWESVTPLLDAYGRQLSRFELLAHQTLVAARTSDSATRVARWNEAMGDAKSGTTPGVFLTLYEFAKKANLETEAEQAMLEAIRLGRGPLPLYEELKFLLNSLAVQGRENDLLQICAIYLPFEPGNPVLMTQYSYLACLNGLADPETILKAVKPMADAFPQALPIQCVLATAYLSAGKAADAATTLDRLKVEPDHLAPGYRAAFLATQVLNRRMTKDDPKITNFPWKSLLPSERRKFGEMIRTFQP